jgi:dTDP-4-dehydrorhamnose 3,5-epimerase-like enzyme
MTTVKDVDLFWLNSIADTTRGGTLVPVELAKDLPFHPERMFYVHNVPQGEVRGQHAHFKTEQVLICLSGQIEVICNDGREKKSFLLDSPERALHIPEMIWDECVYTLQNSVLLVLSSTSYNPDDYIKNYQKFVELKSN